MSSPPASGGEVKPRDVTYGYSNSDPEELLTLQNASGVNAGLPFASYAYDNAGNQVSRCYGTVASPCNGDETLYVYDGNDQLRRATKKSGGVVQGSEEYWYYANGARAAVLKRDSAGNITELVRWVGDAEYHNGPTFAPLKYYAYVTVGVPIERVTHTSPTVSTGEYQFLGLGDNVMATLDAGSTTVNARFSYRSFRCTH